MFHNLLALISPIGVLPQSGGAFQTEITLRINLEQLVTWIIIGMIAGFLAGAIVRGRRFGFITSVIVGLIGALIGGFLFAVLNIRTPAFLSGEITIRIIDIVVAFVGAVILLLILGLFYRYRRPL